MAWSVPRGAKTILAPLINAGGFAVFLLVAFATRGYRWGFIADVLALWLLWKVLRPAGIRWAREVRRGEAAQTRPRADGPAGGPDDGRARHG